MRKTQKEVHQVHWRFVFMSLGGELVVFPHVHEVHHVHQVHWKRLNLAAISCEENAVSQRLQSSKSLIFKEQEFPLPPRRSAPLNVAVRHLLTQVETRSQQGFCLFFAHGDDSGCGYESPVLKTRSS
jgi:hypothetical protein